jgi:hypothetical protein
MIVAFRDSFPEKYRKQLSPYLNGMILNSIATSKQSAGMTEQADYVYSKLPAALKSGSTFEVAIESLQKYTGEYTDSNSKIIKLVLKDDKTLNFIIPDGPVMELVPLSKNKFSVKYMDGITVEFVLNRKDEVAELLFTSPGVQQKAIKTK